MRHLFSCASCPLLWQVSIGIHSHAFLVSRSAVLLKDVIITVFIQLWHQRAFYHVSRTFVIKSEKA